VGQTGQGKNRGIVFFFFVKKETKIINLEQEFLYNAE